MVNLGILGTAVAPAGILIDKIQAGFYWLMLLIDTTLAWVSDVLFNIFFALAKVNIFSQEAYADIVKRVYIVLGLIMLFALAYSLLKAVINPDEFAKGEYSFPKLIQNVVVSLIIIAVLPTVFSMATNFQNAILNEGTIPKIILGKDTATDSCDAGRSFSYHILSAFLFPNKEWCTENNYSLTKDSDGKAVTDSNASECAENIKTSDGSIFHAGQSLSEITNEFLNDTSKPSIKIFVNFNEAAVDGEMTYLVVISTIAMIFLLIAILNFCFDMAIRIFRLIFFEIIAPIPVICRIIPGGKMKDVFGTWVKKTLSTFADIFIRLVVIYFVLFLFDKINEARQSIVLPCLNVVTSKLAWALVYMGLIAFMRQAPKVICDLFHLDPGNLKMGFGDLKDKFAEGGGFVAGAAFGAGATTLGRNTVAAVKNVIKAKGVKGKVGAVAKGLVSPVAGLGSGAARGFAGSLGAKSFKDMKSSINKAATDADKARMKRAEYYKANGSYNDTWQNVTHLATGHLYDAVGSVASYFGITSGIQELQEDNERIDLINSKKKAVKTAVEDLLDGEANKEGTNKSYNVSGAATLTDSQGNTTTVAFNTAALRSMKQAKDAAIASGAANAADLQNAYDSYRKQFVDAVQKYAYLGKDDYQAMLDNYKNSFTGLTEEEKEKEMRKLQADFVDMRNASSDFRRSVKDNLTASYVVASGFTAANIDENVTLDPKTGPVDAIGDNLKIAKSENIAKINEIRQKENKDKK